MKATELDLGDLRARRLSVGTSKTLRASTETWVAHEPGDPFASVGQSKRELAAHPKPCDCIDCSIAGKPTH